MGEDEDDDKNIRSNLVIEWFSDIVDYSWQIEKLKSWHWVLVTDSRRVTWTAFTMLGMFMRTIRHRDSSSSSHHSSRASVLDTSGSTASTTLSVEQVPKRSSLNIFFRWKKSDDFFSSNYCAVEISSLCFGTTISTRHILRALSLLLFFQ